VNNEAGCTCNFGGETHIVFCDTRSGQWDLSRVNCNY
jgi:hypothetical protein